MLYDPFTYETLMAGTVLEFEKQVLHRLDETIAITGPGIYCLFYEGALEEYRDISGTDTPIYAGKAIPPGSRRGGEGDVTAPALQSRIRQHQRSIEQANNLDVQDFTYRYLAIVTTWINLAERFVIRHYQPAWNACLDGFGDHDPGRGRYRGERSWWDTLHPGRLWAERLQEIKAVADARSRLAEFFVSKAT